MIKQAKVGGRSLGKKDFRSLRNWVGRLDLIVNVEGQQFVLSAIYDILSGNSKSKPDVKAAWNAICKVAERKRDEFRAEEEKHGNCIRIEQEQGVLSAPTP